jgi:gliding motility-associated-like protein
MPKILKLQKTFLRYMGKFFLLLTLLFCAYQSNSQAVHWQETFDPSPTTWNLSGSFGANDPEANIWFISDDESGMPVGSCGTAGAGNQSLHLTSVPTLLGGGYTGAAYNAGGFCGFGFFCVETNTRASTPNISTVAVASTMTLSFDYIENGDGAVDDFFLQYSINGGSTWIALSNPPKTTVSAACFGQGLWTNYTVVLPAACNGIPNLQIGFCWTNNDDGVGTDPSAAINDVKILVPTTSSNTQPIAVNNTNSGACNTAIITNVLSNDSDPDAGQTISITNTFGLPMGATATFSGNNITFNPPSGGSGTYTFSYIITDNGTPALLDTATVSITISACNQKPNAANDVNSGACNSAVITNVLSNDSDPDAGQTISITNTFGLPAGATTTFSGNNITFNPPAGGSGTYTFSYIITDNGSPALLDTATLSITLSACNQSPLAILDTISGPCTTPIIINVALNDTDPDAGQTLTVTGTTGVPAGVTVVLSGNTYTITSTSGASITFSFTYTITDNGTPALSSNGTVVVSIYGCNTVPSAINDTSSVNCNTTATINPLLNDIDPDAGQVLSVINTIGAPVGSVLTFTSNSVSFTPPLNTNGTFTFSYVIADNGTPVFNDTAQITVVVSGCNVAPVAVNDVASVNCNQSTSVNVISNDTDNNAGQIISLNNIFGGSAGVIFTVTGNTISFTPPPTTSGTFTVNYIVCDNGSPVLCDTGLLSITVAPCVASPIATNDTITVACATAFNFNPTTNDTDPDGGGVSLVASQFPITNNGTFTLAGTVITFTPANGYVGTFSIPIIITDNDAPASFDTSVLVVTVLPCPPVASFIANDTFICEGDCINYLDQSTGGATSWQWTFTGGTPSSSSVQNPSNICYDAPGTYAVTLVASNANGSSTPYSITNYVVVQAKPIALNVTFQDTIGKVVTMNATSANAVSYVWQPSAGLSINNGIATHTVALASTYSCIVTTNAGCVDTFVYNVVPVAVVIPATNLLWVPNAFSPNGDADNNTWKPRTANVASYKAMVFDRWGQRVFETTDPQQAWNGTYKGLEQSGVNVFFYYVEATFIDGNKQILKGDLTLIQ